MDSQPYDIAFCGFGIGACLLLRELDRRRLLAGQRICIFEPELKLTNDKTLCFWGEPDSPLVKENADIVTRIWDNAQVPPNGKQSLAPFRYYQIDNLTLYTQVREMLKQYTVEVIQAAVLDLECSNQMIKISTATENCLAHKVYDSRPPTQNERKAQRKI